MKGYGWAYARRVMRSVHQGDIVTTLALVDAQHAKLDHERKDVDATSHAFEFSEKHRGASGQADNFFTPTSPMRAGAAARWANVDESSLRFWEDQ